MSKLKRVCFNSNVFAKMTSLRLLKVHLGVYYHHFGCIHEKDYYAIIKNTSKMRLDMKFEFPYELRYLYSDGYPLDFLPSNFDGEKLVELHLKCSNIKQLWQGHKVLLSFNNDFFFFVLILKFMIVMSLLKLIFFWYSILKG